MDEAAFTLYGQRLQEWHRGFKKLIASRERASTLSTAERKAIALLEFHSQDVSLNMKVVAPRTGVHERNLLKWDKYTDEFSDMVDNAAIAIGMDDHDSSGEDPQFHMHFGVTSILKSLITRCRDPSIRRRAIAVMAAKPVQEGVFNSDLAVKITRRIVALEEGKITVRSCKDIPEEARLLFSSLHVGSEDTQVMVRFTFKYGSWEEAFETGVSS